VDNHAHDINTKPRPSQGEDRGKQKKRTSGNTRPDLPAKVDEVMALAGLLALLIPVRLPIPRYRDSDFGGTRI